MSDTPGGANSELVPSPVINFGAARSPLAQPPGRAAVLNTPGVVVFGDPTAVHVARKGDGSGVHTPAPSGSRTN